MTAALYFEPDSYRTDGPRLMGRQMAGHQFLRALLRERVGTELWAYVPGPDDAAGVAQTVHALQPQARLKVLTPAQQQLLSQPGVLHFPSPNLGALAWQRSVAGHGCYSLCGVTHTTNSMVVTQGLAQLITAPVQPWDALVCTSSTVKDNVTRVLQAELQHLKQRLGATRVVLPQLPVIPLGVPAQDFVFDSHQRGTARQALGVGEDTLVVLYMGRLSFHAKVHPLAMYQALELAAQATGREVVLVECGWFAGAQVQAAFEQAAQHACPSVRIVHLDGRVPDRRDTAWAAADVFCSLSDNFQESFGITPLEAMAAALPVVVSDWDGYRDTVRDGVDGFWIPTTMPEPGLGQDLAQRYGLGMDSYDTYCALTSTLVAVDVPAAAQAFRRLFLAPELRQQMGQAGRARVLEAFDWPVIIARYEALWAQQRELRLAQQEPPRQAPRPSDWPAQLDPFFAFESYASHTLTDASLLGLADADLASALPRLRGLRALTLVGYAHLVLPDDTEIEAVLHAAQGGPQTSLALLQGIAPARRAFVQRALPWLLKLGVLKLYATPGVATSKTEG